MSLTPHALKIDQNRAGWLDRARTEGPRLLEAAGCAAMARELRAELGQAPPLETLARYLRLELTAGAAAERLTPSWTGGAITFTPDGTGSLGGVLPQKVSRRQLDVLWEGRAERVESILTYGEVLVSAGVADDGEPLPWFLRADRMRPDGAVEPLWRRRMARLQWPMACDGEVVVVESRADSIYRREAFRLEDGEPAWEQATLPADNPIRALGRGAKALAAAEGMVLIQSQQFLRALDSRSGRRLWLVSLFNPSAQQDAAIGRLMAPVMGAGVVYQRVPGDREVALNAHGEIVWQKEADDRLVRSCVVGERLVQWSVGAGDPVERDLRTGRQLLVHDTGGVFWGDLRATESHRVFLHDTHLRAVSPEGKPLWRRTVPSGSIRALEAIVGETILLRSEMDRYLDAYSLADGRELWSERFDQGAALFGPLGDGLAVLDRAGQAHHLGPA